MLGLPRGRVAHTDARCSQVRRPADLQELPDGHGRRLCTACAARNRGNECLICTDTVPVQRRAKTRCHTVCETCMRTHVAVLHENPQWDGSVRCPCGSSDHVMYTVVRKRAEERQRPANLVDNALTLRCPHCDGAFAEFDGCAAVYCRCGQFFCALCLKACSSNKDAHDHVLTCPRNPGNGFYVKHEEWLDLMHALRCQRARESVALALSEHGACYALHIGREFVRHKMYFCESRVKQVCGASVAIALMGFFPRFTLLSCAMLALWT
jgi:hypothetical protein